MLDPSRLCQLEIPVADVERALAFYAAAFGWRRSPAELHDYVILEVPASCPFGIALVVDRGSTADRVRRSGPTVYFAVDDPEVVVQAVEAAGGRKRFGPSRVAGYGLIFQVEDPEGNRFGLHQTAAPVRPSSP